VSLIKKLLENQTTIISLSAPWQEARGAVLVGEMDAQQ
jgi:hypothetical protein